MKVAEEALLKVAKMLPKGSRILDVGAGDHTHAEWFKARGYDVVTTDIADGNDYVGDFDKIYGDIYRREGQFDCVWCSHVVEHVPNVGLWLEKLQHMCKDGGILAITVPPRKDALVGGHLNLFTPLSLIYNMILTGLNCKEASMKVYGYNISVVVRKDVVTLPKQIVFDRGDIETLAHLFPCNVRQNLNGFILEEINW